MLPVMDYIKRIAMVSHVKRLLSVVPLGFLIFNLRVPALVRIMVPSSFALPRGA